MKVMHLNFVKFAACMVLVVGLSTRALASCGDSLSAMAAGAAAVVSQSRPPQPDSQSSGDDPVNSSIIGLWHIQFTIHDQTIQEAYQLWNAGGTEVHNPNVDPRTGNVCLGCGSGQLRAGLTSSRTACGTTTQAETSWEPSTSGRRLLWVTVAIRTVVPSPWISMALPATSSWR